jgi:predicted enzyme related to lactoylglutathione lyase
VQRVILASEGYARAGIVPLPPTVKKPGWLPYVLVDDVPGVLQKVTAAGGHVLLPPRADLLDGNLAVIADPRGGVFGVVDWVGDSDDAAQANGSSRQDSAKEGAK